MSFQQLKAHAWDHFFRSQASGTNSQPVFHCWSESVGFPSDLFLHLFPFVVLTDLYFSITTNSTISFSPTPFLWGLVCNNSNATWGLDIAGNHPVFRADQEIRHYSIQGFGDFFIWTISLAFKTSLCNDSRHDEVNTKKNTKNCVVISVVISGITVVILE